MRETTEGLAGTRAKQGSGKRPELSFWLRHSLLLLLDSAVLGLQGSYPRNGRRALDPRGLAWNGWLRALPTRLPMERDFTPSVIAVDPQERRGKKGCKFPGGTTDRESEAASGNFAGSTEWPAQEREQPRLAAPPRLRGPFKIYPVFNTIRQKLVPSGKTRIGTTSIPYSR